ncbi:MAG: restriction endonuclease subunit S [Rhodospirillales bacterium]|nr:restriction endonuclease subunit S [Rhodospirillales bacterium]
MTLPRGWADVTLRDVVELKYGKSLPDKTRQDGDVPVYGSNGKVGVHSEALTLGETIIVGRKGSAGKVHCSSRPCYPIDTTYYVDEFAVADIGFVAPLLVSLGLDKLDRATAVPGLNREEAYSLKVNLPPLAEQRRIVAKLDALTARITRARAELDRVPILAEKMRAATLKAGVTGALTHDWRQVRPQESVETMLLRIPSPTQGRGGREATDKLIKGSAGLSVNDPGTPLPEDWKWVPLLRLARQETGHTPSRSQPSYWDGGVPWIGIKDAGAHHGRIINETFQTITEEGLENSSARLLPKDTVCLSRTASVGYVTIMGRTMATSQDFATWTCTDALMPEYLMYALMAEGDDIRKFGMGSTHTTIYFPEIRALHIALPPIAEQREIIRSISSALARADRLESEAARSKALLDHLESALLARAFRGELVPQNPEDEPATNLLARIRASRATTQKPARARRKTG